MPLSINVGVSRKASENFNSRGCSVSITAELDQALLARPGELQHEIAGLYEQARAAVGAQLAWREPRKDTERVGPGPRASAADHSQTPRHGERGMTPAQRRRIEAAASAVGEDAGALAQRHSGAPLDRLSITQASSLIRTLRSVTPVG